MNDAHDCGADAAAYALGALEPEEAEAFRTHLASCAVCRDEVAAFVVVVDVLPVAVPQQPVPRGLRRRLRRSVRAEPKRMERRRVAFSRPLVAGALAATVALATVGGVELSSGGSGGAHVIQASVIGSAGNAQLRLSGGHAELIVHHLPPPPPGRIYQVWLQRANSRPSPTSALFSVTSSGAGDVDVPGNLSGVKQLMVTPEPAGGSLAPTHSPVIVARLT